MAQPRHHHGFWLERALHIARRFEGFFFSSVGLSCSLLPSALVLSFRCITVATGIPDLSLSRRSSLVAFVHLSDLNSTALSSASPPSFVQVFL